MFVVLSCSWTSAPEGFDCELLWPTTTEESGCCAADTGKAYDRCKGSSCKRDCNAMSDCHWIPGEDADCKWVPPEEPNEPGCCTLCSSQDPDSPYLAVCPDLWNKEDCLTPKDYYGVRRCQWTPTKPNEDCTILWPTESADDQWSQRNERQLADGKELILPLNSLSVMGYSMDSRLSLTAAIVLIVAGIVMCKLARLWTKKHFDRFGGSQSRGQFGYIKIADSADSEPPPVWSNEESYGYGTYSAAS